MEPINYPEGNFGPRGEVYRSNQPCPPYQEMNTVVTTGPISTRPPSTVLLNRVHPPLARPLSASNTWWNRLDISTLPLITSSFNNCFLPISGLVFLLIFSIVINIFLMAWTTFTLDLHKDGLPLKLKPKEDYKFNTDGKLIINGELISGSIEPNPDRFDPNLPTLALEPANPDYLQLKNVPSDSSITFSGSNIELRTGELSIESGGGTSMRVTPDEVTVERPVQRIQQPSGGLRLERLDTSAITADLYRDMRVESRTERVIVKSENEMLLESNNGNVELNAHDQVHLNGKVVAGGRSVIFKPLANSKSHSRHHHHHNQDDNQHQEQLPLVYQLCVCANGRLFATEVENICEADSSVCSEE